MVSYLKECEWCDYQFITLSKASIGYYIGFLEGLIVSVSLCYDGTAYLM